MTMPARRPASIAVMAGRIASQQLAFAHLLDVADRSGRTPDLDAVDVVQGASAGRRLAHYFDATTVAAILSAGDGCDTFVVLTDPAAFPAADTAHLRWLGHFPGQLLRAVPEPPC
jgi:hypothetical protein